MEEIEYKIWFARLNISNKIKLKLIKDFKNCKNVYNLNKQDISGYDDKIINILLDNKFRNKLDKEAYYMLKNNIIIFNIYDELFPQKLLNIEDCPSQIFIRGNLSLLKDDGVAVIGSRRASEYGKNIARSISKDFASLEINVISGLAVGIDKFAHLGALDSLTGRTIAVLGNGISKDVLYPYENLKLYERIISEGGVIVSEYPCFSKPTSYTFPARNRIISGLSDKVIVVEAGPKSGSVITVDFAIEQGKEVFAVPGNINNYNSIGTNKLIKEGANPFLDISDCIGG